MAAETDLDMLYELLTEEQRDAVGKGNFRQIGETFVGHLKTLCRLAPDNAFLDAGSGYGRIAIPLTAYLSAAGRYEGFDTVAASVAWCRQNIAARYPQFGFQHADIFNTAYNPRGKLRPEQYRFPYPDNTFDVAFAGSLFTHLLPNESRNYLSEIARVLKPGGRFLGTFFFLTAEAEAALARGTSTLAFVHPMPGCRVVDAKIPEAAVAFETPLVLGYTRNAGLSVREVFPGWWSDPALAGTCEYQDMVLAERPAAA